MCVYTMPCKFARHGLGWRRLGGRDRRMCEHCMSQTVWISIGLIGLLLVLAAGPLARQLAWLRMCWQARGAPPRPLAAEPGKGGEAKGSARGTQRKAPESPPPPPVQLTTPDVVYAVAMLVG